MGHIIQFFEIKYQKKRKIKCTLNLGNSEGKICYSKRQIGYDRNGEISDSQIQSILFIIASIIERTIPNNKSYI
jgi:hypothetical protein